MLLSALVATAAVDPNAQKDCSYTHVDAHGVWLYNITGIGRTDLDWKAPTGGNQERIVTNICRPLITQCRGTAYAPSAIKQQGDGPVFTCEPLGWGVIGGAGTRWALIDPAQPSEGLRLTLVDLLHVPTLGNVTIDAYTPRDEWGLPRPPVLTMDLVCEPTAPRPAAPLEIVRLLGQPRGDTSLRLKSPLACPVRSMQLSPPACAGVAQPAATAPAAAGARPSPGGQPPSPGSSSPPNDDGSQPASDGGAASSLTHSVGRAVDNDGSIGGPQPKGVGLSFWQLLGVLLAGCGLVGLLLMVLMPLSLRGRLSRQPWRLPEFGEQGEGSMAWARDNDDDEYRSVDVVGGYEERGTSYRAL